MSRTPKGSSPRRAGQARESAAEVARLPMRAAASNPSTREVIVCTLMVLRAATGGRPYRMRRKRASEQPAQQQVPTARSRERIAGGGGGARSGGGQNRRAWRAILHRQALCAIGSAFPAPPAQPSQQVPTNPASAAWNTPKAVRPSREVCASGSQRPFLHAFLAATTACAHSRSSNASNSSICSGRVRKFTGSMRNQVRPLSSVVEIQKRPPCSIRLATLE